MIFDSCKLNDHQIGGILQALSDTHSLSMISLTISNQSIGSHCLEAFQELLPALYSFTLNNIKFELPRRTATCLEEARPRPFEKRLTDTLGSLEGTNELTKSTESVEQKPVGNESHPMSQILSNFVAQGEIKRSLSIKKVQSESKSPLKKQPSGEGKSPLSPQKKKAQAGRRPNILNLKLSGINLST